MRVCAYLKKGHYNRSMWGERLRNRRRYGHYAVWRDGEYR